MLVISGGGIHGVTLDGGGFGGALAGVRCPWCGDTFDPTGGRDGTYWTVNNRLTRVRRLRDRLLATEPESLTIEELATAVEAADPRLAWLAGWLRDHPEIVIGALVQLVVTLLGVFLTVALQPDEPAPPPPGITYDQMQELINSVRESAPPRSDR